MGCHTVVTFLGKGRDNPHTGYRSTNYRFPESEDPVTTPFFGLALANHLGADKVVVLGTAGSQWGVLVEKLVEGQQEQVEEDARLELLEAEQEQSVDKQLLDRLVPLMTKAVGKPVVPRLIKSGQNEKEQYGILNSIAEAVPDGEVSFDLTHGFRHLGMIGLLSAFMLERLERVGNLHVRSLWYGALDMTGGDGITPVIRLDGLTRVQCWLDALNRFDATGDYGVFAPLLIKDGVPEDKAKCLERAAFHERTMNVKGAVQQLQTFLPVLDRPLDGASGLFKERLSKRLRWARENNLAQRQEKLAFEYLKRKDFVRAAIFGLEAFITSECPPDSEHKRDAREQAHNRLKDQAEGNGIAGKKRELFRSLNILRNALAHGNPPNRQYYEKVFKNQNRLCEELKKALQFLKTDRAKHRK